ncbi:hypothetical protein [Marinobacter excellens]|jgi:hypothetical protein|uniref:Uncharacterized protein n=1 Tax=Marinobacter excellens LAMA 842 TaxID=1306954 RepID=A0A137S921_9GAMM|nr:hypothetical protein [Marinobacter excellens]KXO08922.1 hypothetical protein J122_2403 [Marinobacter excellens LAMA 842]
MKPEFPHFYSDPRLGIKRFTALVLIMAVLTSGVFVFEVASYYLADSEIVSNKLKIDRYQKLRNESPDTLVLESKYLDAVSKLDLVSSAHGSSRSLDSVLDSLEKSIDQNSVVERVIFDAGKKHALVYVKSVYPRELESSITSSDVEAMLNFSILSKKTAGKSPYEVIYELRAAL